MNAKKIKRLNSTKPDPDYYWRAVNPEERRVLEESPSEYGQTRSQLKELEKAKRLRDERCVQVSEHRAEAKSWMRAGDGLLRIPRANLQAHEWEKVEGHHFIFVTGDAIVRLHEFVDE